MSVPRSDTICPVCGRLVGFDTPGIGLDGDRVMVFHFIGPGKPKECDGSRRSVTVAWTHAKRQQQASASHSII